LELYHQSNRRSGCGGPVSTSSQRVRPEIIYQRKSEKAFGEENAVRVVIVSETFDIKNLYSAPQTKNVEIC